MRFLFWLSTPGNFGSARVQREVALALQRQGHDVTMVGPEAFGFDPLAACGTWPQRVEVMNGLRAYLRAHGGAYDVVEHDLDFLPFPRGERAPPTLFVARTALLQLHFTSTRLPAPKTLRSLASRLRRGRAERRRIAEFDRVAMATAREADLINVPNDRDRDLLVRRGIGAERVLLLPYAIPAERSARLGAETLPAPPDGPPRIAFLGTFDHRKGAVHFGPVLERLARARPDVQLRLLGCKGLLTEARSVLGFFPRSLRSRVEVKMAFDPAELPALLAGCSAGMFPSYVEGFPLGVLEMLAAHLPVVAFDAPGAPMMLPPDWLVPPGDEAGLARALVGLLAERNALERNRRRARTIADGFSWDDIARKTAEAYTRARETLGKRSA